MKRLFFIASAIFMFFWVFEPRIQPVFAQSYFCTCPCNMPCPGGAGSTNCVLTNSQCDTIVTCTTNNANVQIAVVRTQWTLCKSIKFIRNF